MATKTLTQPSGGSFPPGATTLVFDTSMKDGDNGNIQTVDLNCPAGTIKFNGWGPSNGTLSNVTTSGNDGRGNPTKVTFDIAGTGNLTGNGNDDHYTGSGSYNLRWTQHEGSHDTVQASGGTMTFTYTD